MRLDILAIRHPSRLNRTTLTDLCLFGDPTYAKEELVAECGAAYLCGVCGIANATLANSAAYLQSWMQVLRQDPTMLVHAAAQAQRAAEYTQNLHPDADAVREGAAATPRRLAPTSYPPMAGRAKPTPHRPRLSPFHHDGDLDHGNPPRHHRLSEGCGPPLLTNGVSILQTNQ